MTFISLYNEIGFKRFLGRGRCRFGIRFRVGFRVRVKVRVRVRFRVRFRVVLKEGFKC